MSALEAKMQRLHENFRRYSFENNTSVNYFQLKANIMKFSTLK